MLRKSLQIVSRLTGLQISRVRDAPPDIDAEAVDIIRRVRSYTLTSPERVYGLVQAVRYVVAAGIPGAFVECGVWRGGSMMAAAHALRAMNAVDRDLYLFDTFEGMPEPTSADVDRRGTPAILNFQRTRRGADDSEWCYAPIDDVLANVLSTGYDKARLKLVKGKVEDTIPANAPEQIALLRLDTDWYESTRHELEHLFPRLVQGGVLILDDYGHWLGSRRATDEYLAAHGINLLLNRVDRTGRVAVKS